jgi:hypothetical protein
MRAISKGCLMGKENVFQSGLISEIKTRFPGCIVMKNDSSLIPGIPDLTILYRSRYALLECKRSENEPHRPNQDYYVDKANEMGGLARFIFPENKECVLNDMERTFKS